MRRSETAEFYRSEVAVALRDEDIITLEELARRIGRSRSSLGAYLLRHDPDNTVQLLLAERRKKQRHSED